MEPVTRSLAKFASNLKYDDLDTRIIQNFKKYFLDGIGCGIYGNSFTWCQIVNEFIKEQGEKRSRLYGCRDLEDPVRMLLLASV